LSARGQETAAARAAAAAPAAESRRAAPVAPATALPARDAIDAIDAIDPRRLRWLALAAAAAAVATRVPFAARRLWDHDSVQFALGVEKYDLAAHHPHPPGYPLYIAMLKLLAALGVDAAGAMVALAIAAAALGAGLIVLLAARLAAEAAAAKPPGGAAAPGAAAAVVAGAATGAGGGAGGALPMAAAALAATLYVFNPLLWFYGELPLVYSVEGGMTVGLAYAALRMADGRVPFVAACAVFALAGGVRPSTLVLLLPLFLLGVWRACRVWGARGAGGGWPVRGAPGVPGAPGRYRGGDVREQRRAALVTLAAGLAAGGAVGLAWLVPLLAAAGGIAAYRRIGSENFNALLPYTSVLYGAGWRALAHNLTIMTKWGLQGMVPAAVALAALWLPGGAGRHGRARIAAGARLLGASWPWLAAWSLPPALFLALFHVTKAGYTLIYLPALLVAASLLAAPAMVEGEVRSAAARSAAIRSAAAILLAAAGGAALFLFGADRRPDQPRALAVVRNELNRHAIATYERDLDRLLTALRRMPPATTVLATVELSGTGPAGAEGFLYPLQRHLQWYLPGYEVLHLVPEERLAFVTRGHRPFHREGPRLELPPGTRQLAIVLSGPTGERFPLGAWPPRRIGDTFWLVVVPLPAAGRLDLGPFTLEAPAAPGARKAAA
jgi:hypothetical protein